MSLVSDWSRRSFVQRVLAGTGAAFVPLLDADWARAQGAPKRLILMSKTNGLNLPGFFPPTPAGGEIALTAIGSPPPLLASLSRRFKDLLVLGGIEQTTMKELPSPNGHHSASHTFTGAAGTTINSGGVSRFDGGGISLDQWLAQQIGKTVNLPYPTMNLSVNGGGDKISWRGRDQGVTNEDNPYTVFTRLFGARNLPAAQVDKQRAERKSVLDFVSGRFATTGKRVGTEDRAKLDFHAQSIRDLERRLTAIGSQSGCATPTLTPSNLMLAAQDQIPSRISAQIDLIVGAMACDMTRTATLKVGGFGDHALLWLGDEFKRLCTPGTCSAGKPTSYHDVSHQQSKPDWVDLKRRADQFFLEAMMLYALDKLEAVKEGGGTMLDNTLVVLADDMGNGTSHAQQDIPWIIGGNIAGRLKTNRFVHQGRRSHNGVLVAIAHLMGHPVETFGDPKFGGLYPGLVG